ncbi:MAG: type 2 isopentenyl-diphosphate Delta-isomerase [Planctomycetota bacterium]
MTRHRKADHIRICLNEPVGNAVTRTGFDEIRLPHEGLPELHKAEIDLSATVFGKTVAAPILISCMTGGSELAKVINQRLARAAQKHGLALGLGSQRALLVDPGLLDTYAVRDLAPDVLLFGNVGAVQLNYGMTRADCDRLVEMVGADVLALHLNPLQEAVQPEGDVDFRGLKTKIRDLAQETGYPVILKEVGNGIGPALARWVGGTALAGVDVAGAGGTSWSRVESYRSDSPLVQQVGRTFGEWGWPTAEALAHARAALPDKVVIASGGVRHGLDAAKAIAMGADLVGLARPFLEAAATSDAALDTMIRTLLEELRVALFCTGARDVNALRSVGIEPQGRNAS